MHTRIYDEDRVFGVEDLQAFAVGRRLILAAGGLVEDEEDRLLLIFRRGRWDLPKGKAEPGESLEVCADREIREETGLALLNAPRPLAVTYHIYEEKGAAILKETHWFRFRAPSGQRLKPQVEEDIRDLRWIRAFELEDYRPRMYRMIADLITKAIAAEGH